MSRYPPFTTSYRDDPQTHTLSAASTGRPESTELTDYWENNQVPAPHRFADNPQTSPFDPRDSLDHNPFETTSDPFDPYSRQVPQPQGDMHTGYDYRGGPGAGIGDEYNALNHSGSNGNRDFGAVPRSQPWTNEKSAGGSRRRKVLIISGIAGLVVIAIIGIVVGVVVSKSHKPSDTTTSPSGDKSHPSSSSLFSKNLNANVTGNYFNVVPWNDNNDPSSFKKDDNLKNAFWAVAYTPFGSQIPDCGSNLEAVIEDMQLISQITTRLRLYGADCNQSALVLDAIQRTKVDLTVWLGNYVLPDDDAGYERQRDEINSALQTFGADHVEGVTVGNEFMLNYLNAHGAGVSDPNSDVGNQGAQYLISKISDTRNSLKGLKLGKTLQVGTADAGAFFNNMVLGAVDYGMANVHPWFANQTIDAAASWTTSFFQDTDIAAANAVANKPQMYIAETGWPTNSKDPGSGSDGPSIASVDNLQIFVNNFVCPSNSGGINYFFFEVFDEPWKDAQFGGVEGYWGLFNYNKTVKAPLTFPTCSHS